MERDRDRKPPAARCALLVAVAVVAICHPVLAETKRVSVFNFQMKSATPDWVWLEKGLADRITTDLHQSGDLTLIARDRMQRLAMEIRWVPDLATRDPGRFGKIRSLRIKYVVSGVYSVEGDIITISTHVIEVDTRKEVWRKEMSGKTADVLDLQRLVSAQVLNWLTQRPVAEILAKLPIWTRSVPAVRAVYQGMDLYDKGRYAEAWVHFRKASRDDPAYLESRYWVGKMYYFMNRYEHARRAFEQFVYMDHKHPRVRDAILEYLHTHQTAGVPADTMLGLFKYIRENFPKLENAFSRWERTLAETLQKESGRLLAQMGRYKQSALAWGHGIDGPFMEGAVAHRVLTGECLPAKVILGFEPDSDWCWGPHVIPRPGSSTFMQYMRRIPPGVRDPETIMGRSNSHRADSKIAFHARTAAIPPGQILAAPSGHVIKSLRFFPVVDGDDANVVVRVCRVRGEFRRYGPDRSMPVARARKEGLVWDGFFPEAGYLTIRWSVVVHDEENSPPVTVRGMKIQIQTAKQKHHSGVEVSCPDTTDFHVDVDGKYAGSGPGLIGPLPPGKHSLRFYPGVGRAFYGERTIDVQVPAKGVVKATTTLSWRPRGPWARWRSATVPSARGIYSVITSRQAPYPGGLTVQSDASAIRLVWDHDGDLWTSVSTDGNTFSRARCFKLPVNSGWKEQVPRLLRDESGRFVLFFISDRDAAHDKHVYVTWSRDFQSWSAPVMIVPRPLTDYDVIQDNRGRLVMVHYSRYGRSTFNIVTSRDGYRWRTEAVRQIQRRAGPYNLSFGELRLGQRTDGRYALYVGARGQKLKTGASRPFRVFLRYVTSDLRKWGDPKFAVFRSIRNYCGFDVVHENGRSAVVGILGNREGTSAKFFLLREKQSDEWWGQADIPGPPSWARLQMTHHPRWGFLLAVLKHTAGRPAIRPFVLRGSDVESAFRPEFAVDPKDRPRKPPEHPTQFLGYGSGRLLGSWRSGISKIEGGKTPTDKTKSHRPVLMTADVWQDAKPRLAPKKRVALYDSDGFTSSDRTTERLIDDNEPNVPTRAPADRPVGQLVRIVTERSESLIQEDFVADRQEQFTRARRAKGIANRHAVMTSFKRKGFHVHLAIDADTPKRSLPNRLRVDFTAKSDFKGGYSLTLAGRAYNRQTRTYSCSFVLEPRLFQIGGMEIPAFFWSTYTQAPYKRKLRFSLHSGLEGHCRFGKTVRTIRLIDNNSNLRVTDHPRAVYKGRRPFRVTGGDTFRLQVPGRPPEQWQKGFFGQPISVDGTLYDLDISEDRLTVVARPYAGKIGLVHIDRPRWEAWLINKQQAMIVTGGPEPVPVPAGRYNVLYFRQYGRRTEKGRTHEGWVSIPYGHSSRHEMYMYKGPFPVVDVVAGKTTKPDLNRPLVGKLDAEVRMSRWRIKGNKMVVAIYIKWQDFRGADVHRYSWDKEYSPPGPTVEIRDTNGKLIKTFSSTWWGKTSRAGWEYPKGLKGKFTVTAKSDGFFKVVVPGKVEITIP